MKSWLGSDKLPSVILSLVLIAGMTLAVSYSPTLYRMFCAATGYGGAVTVKRSLVPDEQNPAIGAEITVRLDTNVAPGLDWDFKPEHPFVKTHIGLPTTVFFFAHNRSDKTVVARATYNVTPDAAGFFFTKTQCFCFSEETLKPGETARMPVVFYIDPDISKDIDAQNIRTITLSYTFFNQPEAVAAAHTLGDRGKAQVEVLKTATEAEFEPAEVRRR